jgi:hypothetical protein
LSQPSGYISAAAPSTNGGNSGDKDGAIKTKDEKRANIVRKMTLFLFAIIIIEFIFSANSPI